MQKFKIGEAEKSTIDAWYNTYEGIAAKISSLAGLNELIYTRHMAGYQRDENLSEFHILGNWMTDSCGNFAKADRDIKALFPTIPDILSKNEFWEFIKINHPDSDNFMISFSYESGIPPSHIVCPVCQKGWDISNCYDTVIREGGSDEKYISLSDFVGQTIAQVREFFEAKTDAIYRMNQPELIIRNDRFIDLTPDPDYAEYNEKYPDQKSVINKSGWVGVKHGIDDDYVIQAGDDGYFNIWRYFHHTCNRQWVNQKGLEQFQRIFEKAGWNDLDLRFLTTPNQYCSCDYCASWYNVNTKYGTGILIGWRKRVINIDWSKWGIDFSYLFKGEEVTKGPFGIHAWGEGKAIQYLSLIRQELNKAEIEDKITNCLEKKINKAATIQNIFDWANRSIGHSIDVQKFKEKMDGPDWEEFLVEAAKFCKVDVVYL